MMRQVYKPLLIMMWLALVSSALNYWRAWDQLPARMAVHFDANWQPNRYTSKEAAVELGLGIMGVMLVLFTVAGLIARAEAGGRAAHVGCLLCGLGSVVVRQLFDRQVQPKRATGSFRIDGSGWRKRLPVLSRHSLSPGVCGSKSEN